MLANPLMQSINNPMTVNSYLTNRASNAILSTGEQDSINRSVATLQMRLNSYFGSKLNSHFRFGSSTRGTILPRSMDGHSDIDYMVVFAEGGYTPQTYLNRLRQTSSSPHRPSCWNSTTSNLTLCPHLPTCGEATRFQMEQARGKIQTLMISMAS